MNKKEKMGYFALGIGFDYFLGRPARKIQPLWYIGIGTIIGALYVTGLDKIFALFV